jgi:hypothetical protein
MTTKKMQKMFYYSSETIKKLIESRIEDISVKTQRSSSFIIENLLLDGLLPKNEEAKSIIRCNLYPDDEQGGVKKTLDAIFSANAEGINWQAKHDNFKPLVEFCTYYCNADPICNGNEGHLHYLLSQLQDIVDSIENCRDACIEPLDRKMYSSQCRMAKSLYNIAENNPKEIVFKNHFQLVYDCWEMLDNWSITYRYLSCLTVMCDFQENANARNRLYDIISEISEEW